MIRKSHFHKKGFALVLVLKQRLAASRKWHIEIKIEYKEKTDKVAFTLVRENIIQMVLLQLTLGV